MGGQLNTWHIYGAAIQKHLSCERATRMVKRWVPRIEGTRAWGFATSSYALIYWYYTRWTFVYYRKRVPRRWFLAYRILWDARQVKWGTCCSITTGSLWRLLLQPKGTKKSTASYSTAAIKAVLETVGPDWLCGCRTWRSHIPGWEYEYGTRYTGSHNSPTSKKCWSSIGERNATSCTGLVSSDAGWICRRLMNESRAIPARTCSADVNNTYDQRKGSACACTALLSETSNLLCENLDEILDLGIIKRNSTSA